MIIYEDIPHTYKHAETGAEFMSATTFLKQFEPKVDWEEKAAKYAKKHNKAVKKETGTDPETTGDYWLHKWNTKRIAAGDKGSIFHAKAEDYVIEKAKETGEFIKPTPMVENVKESFNLRNLQDGLYPELIIWANKAKIAGQADLVRIKDGYIHILDYKTNEKLTSKPYIRWDGSLDSLEAPLSHIPNTKLHKYYMQLNLYAFMLKKHNPKLKIGDLVIRHIQFDEDGKAKGYYDYVGPDYQEEIRNILSIREEDVLF